MTPAGVFLLLGAAAHPAVLPPVQQNAAPFAPRAGVFRAPVAEQPDLPAMPHELARTAAETVAPLDDQYKQDQQQFGAAEVLGVSPVVYHDDRVSPATCVGAFFAAVATGVLLHARDSRFRDSGAFGTLTGESPAAAVFLVTPENTPLRRVLLKFNSASKWLVLLVNTLVVWKTRSFAAPFIVTGAIPSAFLAKALKKVINQARPAGAEPLDPGMPSSHSLVTFFLATAWIQHLLGSALSPVAGPALVVPSVLVAVGAVVVAGLRVACKYHTVPQVLVGAGVGAACASAWTAAGAALLRRVDYRAAVLFAFVAYLGMMTLFVRSFVMKWLSSKKQPVVPQSSSSQFLAEGERGEITPQEGAAIEPASPLSV